MNAETRLLELIRTPEPPSAATDRSSAPGSGFTNLLGDIGSLASFSPNGVFNFNAEWQNKGAGDHAIDVVIESTERDQADGRRPIPPALLSQALRDAADFVDCVRTMSYEHPAYHYNAEKRRRFLRLKNRFTIPKAKVPGPEPKYIGTGKCLYYDQCKQAAEGEDNICVGCNDRTGIWLDFATDDIGMYRNHDPAMRPNKRLKRSFDEPDIKTEVVDLSI